MTRHILFDLDGTVADTAPDLALALNLLREESGQLPLDFDRIRPVVSLGATAMLKLAFTVEEQNPEFARLRNRFLELYSQNILCKSRLFPGISVVLDYLDENKMPWGIVTNKPGWLTRPLLDALTLTHRCKCIISGDTLPQRKPHPAPLLYACDLMSCPPADTTYIGDALTDIKAGASAGMTTGIARYGYLEPGATPDSWGADVIFDEPVEILAWLQKKYP
jgi:2-phosphoglycolate phosphatase